MKVKVLMCIAVILFYGCRKEEKVNAQTMTQKLYVTIGTETRSVTMEDNVGTQALVAALENADITYVAHDYGNFEKVGYIGQSFPTTDHQLTTSAGDLVLYNGDNICIFYGSNSWSYTFIGHLDGMSADEVRQFVNAGGGDVSITLSLHPTPTGVEELMNDNDGNGDEYTILGQKAPKNYKGIIIKNGKKIIR